MSKKRKELILKGVIVLGVCAMIVFVALTLICCFPSDIPISTISTAFCVDGVVWGVSALSLLILFPIFGGVEVAPIRADRFPVPYKSHDELYRFLEQSLIENGYDVISMATLGTNMYVYLFGHQTYWGLHLFVLTRVSELIEDDIAMVNDYITKSLLEHLNIKKITDTVSVIGLFCVDRVTPFFRSLMNTSAKQGLKNRRLSTGISFGSNTLYVACQRGGLMPAEYRRLRKEFFGILGIDDKM